MEFSLRHFKDCCTSILKLDGSKCPVGHGHYIKTSIGTKVGIWRIQGKAAPATLNHGKATPTINRQRSQTLTWNLKRPNLCSPQLFLRSWWHTQSSPQDVQMNWVGLIKSRGRSDTGVIIERGRKDQIKYPRSRIGRVREHPADQGVIGGKSGVGFTEIPQIQHLLPASKWCPLQYPQTWKDTYIQRKCQLVWLQPKGPCWCIVLGVWGSVFSSTALKGTVMWWWWHLLPYNETDTQRQGSCLVVVQPSAPNQQPNLRGRW